MWTAERRWQWPCHTRHSLALGFMSPDDAPPATGEGWSGVSPHVACFKGVGPQGGWAEVGPIDRAMMALSMSEAGSEPDTHKEPTLQTCDLPVPSASASHRPTPCPIGTFSSLPEQTVPSVCQACPHGFYCKEAGLQAPSGQCPAGERQQGFRQRSIALWAVSPQVWPFRALVAEEPPRTKYLWERAVLSIPHSWAGYYWDSSARPIQDFSLYPCSQGYYCPLGTVMATQHSCPVGTYGPRKGLRSITECQLCPAGKFCALAGLKAPTGMS